MIVADKIVLVFDALAIRLAQWPSKTSTSGSDVSRNSIDDHGAPSDVQRKQSVSVKNGGSDAPARKRVHY